MLKRTAARLGEVDQVVGDKAFDGAVQRRACAAIGAEAVIPAKRNRVDPEPLDGAAYRERNRVEKDQADSTSSDRWCGATGPGYDRRRRAA
jgi:hypothetical protein